MSRLGDKIRARMKAEGRTDEQADKSAAKFGRLITKERTTTTTERHRRKRKKVAATQAREQTKNAVKLERSLRTRGLIKPEFTRNLAHQVAVLLAAGVPPNDAVRYLAPKYWDGLDEPARTDYAKEIAGSLLLVDAMSELNGGKWEELEPARRLQLALDKHLAELAHFLYTHSYANETGVGLDKMDAAAKRLTDYLTDSDGSDETPWKRFVTEFMSKIEGDRQVADLPAFPVLVES